MTSDVLGKVVEVEFGQILSFSENLEKIETITLKAIKERALLLETIESFFEMLNKGELIRNENIDQNEITVKLVTFLKIIEDIRKGIRQA